MKDIIKNALEKANMTQKELAGRIHVSQQAVSQWVKGEKLPSRDNIEWMVGIFGHEFGEEILKKGLKNRRTMNKQPLDIKDLDTYEKAQIEARSILDRSGIQNYTRAVYSLLMWITTAVIGLVYHKYLHNKDSEEEYYFEDIFFYLSDIVDEQTRGGEIEQAFYYMGGDLFESFGDCKMENHDYAHDCMDLWYKFKKVYDYNEESDLNREFKIALLDVIQENSCY